jgi:hypothetical protein
VKKIPTISIWNNPYHMLPEREVIKFREHVRLCCEGRQIKYKRSKWFHDMTSTKEIVEKIIERIYVEEEV